MADKTLKSLTFPGLSDKYVIPDLEVDDTLTQQGKAADAKAVGDALTALESDISTMSEDIANKADIITDTATGAIASFPDGADGLPLKSLVASIDPVQDLHGFDSPWPAGGGKNRLKITATSTTINGITYTVNEDGTIVANGTASDISNFILVNGTGIFNFDGEMILNGSVSDFGNNVRTRFGVSSPAATYDDFGNGVTIPQISDISTRYAYVQITINSGITVNNIVFKPMIRLASVTDATFAPYSNECPISGWTGLEGKRMGKNLFDPNSSDKYWVNASNEITTIDVSKSVSIPVAAGQTITLSNETPSSGTNILLIAFVGDGSTVLSRNVVYNGNKYITATAPTGTVYAIASFYQWLQVVNPQLELGSTASTYEEYQGESLSVSWQDTAGTVYGGTMTVNEDGSGELVSARAKKIFDGTEALSYNRDSATSGYAIYRLGAKNAVAVSESGLSNILKPVTSGLATEDWAQMVQNSGAFNQDQIAFRFTSDFDGGTPSGTVTNYKAELARLYADGTPLEVCYELSTPLVYHFDNLEQLSSVYGINNIWVDTGDVQCEYRADTKLYIDKKLAAIVAALS